MTDANVIVKTARGWIGTPYLHQGSTKGAGAESVSVGLEREGIGSGMRGKVWARRVSAKWVPDYAGRLFMSLGRHGPTMPA